MLNQRPIVVFLAAHFGARLLNYLAAHEVAHLVEMNHSPRFWRLVQKLCPDHERAKAWLDAHGTDLHRYGVSCADPAPR
jgi:predicted metal-dependent hydrolase